MLAFYDKEQNEVALKQNQECFAPASGSLDLEGGCWVLNLRRWGRIVIFFSALGGGLEPPNRFEWNFHILADEGRRESIQECLFL